MLDRLLLLACCLLLAACSPGDGADTTSPDPTPAPPADVTPTPVTAPADSTGATPDAPDTQDRVRKALALIEEMKQAYQRPGAISDRIVIRQFWGGQESAPAVYELALGAGRDIEIKTTSNRIVAVDGQFYLTLPQTEDSLYYNVPLEQDALTTMRSQFGNFRGALSHAALRYGLDTPDILYTLSYGMPDRVRLSNYEVIERPDADGVPRTYETFTLIASIGSVLIGVDPETKWVAWAEVEYTPADAPVATFKVRRQLVFDTKAYDVLPEPIAFDTSGRQPVTSLTLLRRQHDPRAPLPLGVAIGDEAPDFELFSMEGVPYRLSESRGRVVVLLCWSSYSVDSIKDLTKIQYFADYIAKLDAAVDVVPIHCLVGDDPNEAWERAYDYMRKQSVTIPSLMDNDDVFMDAYGLIGLPAVMIVGADGRLLATRPAFGEDLYAWLVEEVDRILADG